MRSFCYLTGVILLCAVRLGYSAESTEDELGAPYYCPIDILYDYGDGNCLHFCDYYETCSHLPDDGYWYGTCKDPYHNCGSADCFDGSHKKDAVVASAAVGTPKADHPSPFRGLNKSVPLSYMHDRNVGNGTPGNTPGSGVNRQRNCHFIVFEDDDKNTHYAKVIEIRLNRPKDTGPDGVTDDEMANSWESRFVAFEVNKDPENENFELHKVMGAERLHANDKYVYRGLISLDNTIGKGVNVLIFLAKPKKNEKN